VSGPVSETTVVVPNWNGRQWLPACLDALAHQRRLPAEVIIVDNGSRDGSLEYLAGCSMPLPVRVLELEVNTGFAHAANRGIEGSRTKLVAVINTDVVLADDWLEQMEVALHDNPGAGSAACKMLSLRDPARIYDAGDILRRDGACEQRGRFLADDGQWDEPGEIFGACAGAAVYRRSAVLGVGGFDERYFAYLEDVDLALRLRLAGWSCRYQPVVALHAGEGSSAQLAGGHHALVTRNTVILVAKSFPARWLGLVAYRQAGWAWHAMRDGRLRAHGRALAGAVPLLPGALRARRKLRAQAVVPIEEAVPSRPFRGPKAGGYRARETTAS
jgi:GT2 family glycosyltransferase